MGAEAVKPGSEANAGQPADADPINGDEAGVAPPAEDVIDPAAPAAAPEIGDEALDDLPPVEAITAETNLAPFLRPGVPTAIRNAALRRKWLLNPTIRDYVDPALDYAWDWNAATPVPGAAGQILASAARKMMDQLIAPPPAEAPAAAPPAPDPVGESSPAATAGGAPVPAADPAPAVAPKAAEGGGSGPAKPTAREAGDEPESAPVQRRRHGGAVPRPR